LPGHNITLKLENEENTFITFIDYVIKFIEYKNFKNVILIGHLMGWGIVTRIEKNPSKNIKKFNVIRNAFFIKKNLKKMLWNKSFLITGENDKIINSKATIKLYKKYILANHCYEIKDNSHLPFIEKKKKSILLKQL